MKIKIADLKRALNAVKPGLAAKDLIEQTTSFAFIDGYIVTYNNELSVRYPINLDIEGAVRSDEFYSLISKVKDDEIDIETTETELIVKGKRNSAGINLDQEIKLPLEELGELDSWTRLPSDFITAVKLAYPCVSDDTSKPALTCIHVNGKHIEASDDYRIIRIVLSKPIKADFAISGMAAKFLEKYDVVQCCQTAGWIHFKTANEAIFSCRIYIFDFPDVSWFLEVKGEELKLPKNMKEILDRAGIFAKAETVLDEEVKIKVDGKKMTIRGEGEYGWFEEVAPCGYGGDPVEFIVGPKFLYDVLDHLQHCIVGENSLKFQGDNFEHVVCLIGD